MRITLYSIQQTLINESLSISVENAIEGIKVDYIRYHCCEIGNVNNAQKPE